MAKDCMHGEHWHVGGSAVSQCGCRGAVSRQGLEVAVRCRVYRERVKGSQEGGHLEEVPLSL